LTAAVASFLFLVPSPLFTLRKAASLQAVPVSNRSATLFEDKHRNLGEAALLLPATSAAASSVRHITAIRRIRPHVGLEESKSSPHAIDVTSVRNPLHEAQNLA